MTESRQSLSILLIALVLALLLVGGFGMNRGWFSSTPGNEVDEATSRPDLSQAKKPGEPANVSNTDGPLPPRESPANAAGNQGSTSKPEGSDPTVPENEKKAARVRPPVLSAKGKTEISRVFVAIPEPHFRRSGFHPVSKPSMEQPTKRVHGRVFELVGGVQIALAGVMVFDGRERHRCFSDDEGRFSFDAEWTPFRRTPQGGDDPQDPATPQVGSSFLVDLTAWAPGYEMLGQFSNKRFYQREVESERGVELVLTRQENEEIEVRIRNPELMRGDVTVMLAAIPEEGGVNRDERMAVATLASADGKAWFSVPPGRFGLRSISGDGVRADFSTVKGLERSGKTRDKRSFVCEVTLASCRNYQVTGVVKDLRTDKPLALALIRGRDHNDLTFADERGNFSLWLNEEPRDAKGRLRGEGDLTLTFEVEGYVWFSRNASPAASASAGAGLAEIGPGGDKGGPWLVRMRPWVQASGQLFLPNYVPASTDLVMIEEPGKSDGLIGLSLEAAIAADGTFRFARVPWGVSRFQVRLANGSTVGLVAERDWLGEEPYHLALEIK